MPFVRSPISNNPTAPQVNPNRNNIVNSGPFGNDFGQFNSSDFMNNTSSGNSQFDLAAKQEMMFSQQQTHHMPQMQSKINPNAFNKQQFPYGSPNTIGIKIASLICISVCYIFSLEKERDRELCFKPKRFVFRFSVVSIILYFRFCSAKFYGPESSTIAAYGK